MGSELPAAIAVRLRFSDELVLASPCWLWTGACSDGYGYVRHGGRMRRVHRVVYELMHGPIPEGRVLDHLCEVKACANPFHLEPVSQRANIQRALGVDRCLRGHFYDEANTYVSPTGRRFCRACKRARREEVRC